MTTYTVRLKNEVGKLYIEVEANSYAHARRLAESDYPGWIVAWLYQGDMNEALNWLETETKGEG